MTKNKKKNHKTATVLEDSSTNSYVAYYQDFPNAVATGGTKREAEKNLRFLVEDIRARKTV